VLFVLAVLVVVLVEVLEGLAVLAGRMGEWCAYVLASSLM